MPLPKYAKVNRRSIDISDIEPADYNARFITQDAFAGLTRAIEELGLLAFPVVNELPNGKFRLIAAHQRVTILQNKGCDKIDCIVVKFDVDKERRANFAMNNKAIQGEFVPELTQALLAEIRSTLESVNPRTFNDLRFDSLVREITRNTRPTAGVDNVETPGKSDEDDEPIIKSAAASKKGMFYKLGNHTIFCGKLETKLNMSGFPVPTADMTFSYIAQDRSISPKYIDTYLRFIVENTAGVMYLATNTQTLPVLQNRFIALGGHWSNTLLWYSLGLKPKDGEIYRDIAKPVLYGWKEGSPHYFCGSREQGNANTYKRAPKSELPVEIITKALLNSSRAHGHILDVDIRRGASVIAAEKTGRRLIGYCSSERDMDVTRARWTRFTHGEGTNWKSAAPEILG